MARAATKGRKRPQPDARAQQRRGGRGRNLSATEQTLFFSRIRRQAKWMFVLLALVFAGGVGENSPEVRRLAAEGLAFLGVRVEPAANKSTGDQDISQTGAPVRTVVVAAREDLEIAREVRLFLSGRSGAGAG